MKWPRALDGSRIVCNSVCMYIRKTQIQKKKSGGYYFTYRIVESQRIGKKVNQRTLLNLGADFSFSEEQWPLLIKRIQDVLYGQQFLFPIDCEVDKWARHYAARIIARQQDEAGDNGIDYREVDVDSLVMNRPRSIGCEHVTLEALRLLDLDSKLCELGFTGPQTALAIGSIIGRACHPGSERETHRWLQDQSGLGELLEHNFEEVSLYKMYQISDLLLNKKSAIEEHLFQKERNLFSLQETITLYDLTNTYFEGQCLSNTLAKRGHSKEKRSDCPLVTLALVLDSSGFPKRSRVFEGNVSEASTLAKMIQELQPTTGLPVGQNPTVVMDAGIATEENIDWLRDNQYLYLVVSRKRHREFDESKSTIVKEDAECTVKAQKIIDNESGEILLYCHSSQREKKERAIGSRFSTRFEKALQYINDGLPIKRRLKKYDKVIEKIGRLKQQYSKAAKLYTVSVEKDKESGNARKITWQRKPAPDTTDTNPGVYCLRTNQADWDESTLWNTYTMLTDLEAVFRSLKSELGLRPVHHHIAERVSGHLFITLLAYHLVHATRYRLRHAGIHDSWATLRNILLPHNRVTVSMQCKNGETVHVRKSVQPDPEQHKIYSALGVKIHPGKIVKTTIATK